MAKTNKSKWGYTAFLFTIFLGIGLWMHSFTIFELPLPVIEQIPQAFGQNKAKAADVPLQLWPMRQSMGLALKINAINLDIPLGKTTLSAAGELLVPKDPTVAAWYENGPKPGQEGSAIITGHLDSSFGPGVFSDLRKLKAGDKIELQQIDGKIAEFIIDKLASYPQDYTFPWDKIYSTTGTPSLRIITCDGTYSTKTGRYDRNLVVYASLAHVN